MGIGGSLRHCTLPTTVALGVRRQPAQRPAQKTAHGRACAVCHLRNAINGAEVDLAAMVTQHCNANTAALF